MENEREKQSSGSGFFPGLVVGTIIGLLVGVMFAPQSGRQSREQLRGKMDELASLSKAAWEEGKEAVSQKGAELQARFTSVRRSQQ